MDHNGCHQLNRVLTHNNNVVKSANPTRGICASKPWSRIRDMKIDQRIMLLQRLQDLRLETSKIRELSARDSQEPPPNEEEADEEAETRAAARAAALEQTPPSNSQIMQIARNLGLRKVGLRTGRIQLTRILKPPGFNP
jgi:hypothetical protein